jgi:hypothetical protein
MAWGFKSGGRKPGSRNKATILREEAMKAAADTAKTALPMVPAERVSPLEYLDNVINSPSPEIDAKLRVTAAGIAARYLHTPATAVDPAAAAKTIDGTAGLPAWSDEDEARKRHLWQRRVWWTQEDRQEHERLSERWGQWFEAKEQQRRALMTPEAREEEDRKRRELGL